MRYLAIYDTTDKIVQGLENYDELATLDDGRSAYRHNVRRYIAESKNRGTPWLYWDKTSAFNLSGYTGDALPNSLLLIGDSRTQGWDHAPSAPFFSEYTTFDNRGVGGDTAENQAIVLPTWGIPKVEKAVISIGVNDWANYHIETVANIGQIISYIKTRAEQVYLTNIPTVNDRIITSMGGSLALYNAVRTHALAVNVYIQQICTNYGIEFIDLYSLLCDTGTGVLKYIYDDNDGLHYNDDGYTAIRALYATHGI